MLHGPSTTYNEVGDSPRRHSSWMLGVVVVLVIALIATGVAMEYFGRQAYNRLGRISEIMVLERTAYSDLLDMHSSMRGYVISRDETFLIPYIAARDSLPAVWERLEVLGREGSTPALGNLIASMKSEAARFTAETVEANISLVREGRVEEAFQRVASGEGHRQFNAIREVHAQLVEAITSRQTTATNELDLARQLELALLVLIGALAATSAIIATRTSRHEADRQQEARLASEAEQRRLLTVIENQPTGIFLVRQADGAVTLQNSAATAIIPREVWNRTPFSERIEHLGLTRVDGAPLSVEELPLTRVFRSGETVTDFEMRLRHAELGEKDLLVSASPLYDDRGRVTSAVMAIHDITQMKHLDQRKDEFIATAAHEIRNPLAALSGYQQILQRVIQRSDAPPSVAKNVEAMGKQVARLNVLVERLLDAQRIQLGRLVLDKGRINLNKLVESVVTDARAAALESHDIVTDLPAEAVRGEWDGTRIEQVLGNLLSNAARYSPDGSRIEVRVKREDGRVRVEVADQGPGVPPDKRARLFDRYYQSENDTTGHLGASRDGGGRQATKRKGLGLGLFISSEIVRAHGGKIGVEPNPDGGSVFWFTLPVA